MNPYLMIFQREMTPIRKLLLMHLAAGGKLTEYTVTGNPVSFDTNVAKPLSVLAAFSPVQSGTGDPSPDNVRPITGWTGANVWRTGANVFNAEAWIALGVNSTKYGIGENCTVTVKENDTSGISNRLISLVPGAVYAYYKDSNFSNVRVFNSSGSSIEYGTSQTFTVPADGKVAIKFYADSYPTTGQFALVPGSVPPTTCEPYTGESVSVMFPAFTKNLIDDTKKYSPNATSCYIGQTSGGYLQRLKAGTYTISCVFAEDNHYGMYFRGKNDAKETKIWGPADADTSKTFTIPNDGDYQVFTYRGATQGGVDSSKIISVMLQTGETATAYEPYTNTAYGGTIDLTTGVLTVEWAGFDFLWKDGANEAAIGTTITMRRFVVGDNVSTGIANNMCNVAQYKSTEDERVHFYYAGIGSGKGARVYLPNETDGYTQIRIISKRPSPLVYQLTPAEILSLVGNNTLWSDLNGDLTVIYKKKG